MLNETTTGRFPTVSKPFGMSGLDEAEYAGSKNSTVLYAGAILTGMTSASFVFNFVLIMVLVVKKRLISSSNF